MPMKSARCEPTEHKERASRSSGSQVSAELADRSLTQSSHHLHHSQALVGAEGIRLGKPLSQAAVHGHRLVGEPLRVDEVEGPVYRGQGCVVLDWIRPRLAAQPAHRLHCEARWAPKGKGNAYDAFGAADGCLSRRGVPQRALESADALLELQQGRHVVFVLAALCAMCAHSAQRGRLSRKGPEQELRAVDAGLEGGGARAGTVVLAEGSVRRAYISDHP
mmetsp:Transcript_5492/g.12108  ORF Transcript_5492/g.12108 Transcript_5492/m.12108 type:complete len:220 (-) Transcript_5492:513-1172(-)